MNGNYADCVRCQQAEYIMGKTRCSFRHDDEIEPEEENDGEQNE